MIYAPRKALKEILQNPKYIGPILVMILFTVANTGFVYVIASKTYFEQTLPIAEQLDKWTENSTLWTAGLGVTSKDNYEDYINGTYYGDKSIEFSIVDAKKISMQLNDIGPINCSGPDGYKNLYLRTKWTNPDDTPNNVSIYLFSAASSPGQFYYDLTEKFSNATNNIWNNLTIPLDSETGDSITGLKLEFTWLESSNITLLVDGLFFGGVFKSPVESAPNFLLNVSLSYFMQSIVKWVLLSGLIYLLARGFRVKTVWRHLLILVGFTLITMFIQAVISAIVFSTLPTLNYPLELIGGVEGEGKIPYSNISEKTWIVSQIYAYIQIVVPLWTVALCAIVTRLLTEFSWGKSFLIAMVAYLVSVLIESLLLGF